MADHKMLVADFFGRLSKGWVDEAVELFNYPALLGSGK